MRITLNRRYLLAVTAALALPGLGQASGDNIVVGQIGPFTGTSVPGAPEINPISLTAVKSPRRAVRSEKTVVTYSTMRQAAWNHRPEAKAG